MLQLQLHHGNHVYKHIIYYAVTLFTCHFIYILSFSMALFL